MTSASDGVGLKVRQQLLRLSREQGVDHHSLLVRFANERLLYRLARSRHAGKFVLKGAALFTVWLGTSHRSTRDLDLLGYGPPDVVSLREVFAQVLSQSVEYDGVRFDEASIEVNPIRENEDYGGVRVELTAMITTVKLRLQIDIGFGDAINPAARVTDFPPLLTFAAPRLKAYPRETVVAEKFEAIVKLGIANSRMKDFYDLSFLAERFDFDEPPLAKALSATFARRGTELPSRRPSGLSMEFSQDPAKKAQWNGFLRKSVGPAPSLAQTSEAIWRFLSRPVKSARSIGEDPQGRWPAGGPWRD